MAEKDDKMSMTDEDDFDIGALKTGKKEEELEKSDEKEKVDEEKKDEGKEKVDEGKEKVDEGKKSSDKEDKDDKSKEKKDEKKNEEPEDLFVDKDDKKEGKRKTLKEIGKKLDVDLEKDDDDEEFERKIAEKLAKSRQDVNLDGYSDDAKALIKHLNENGGDVESFFTNKNIIGLQSVLSLDAETKVSQVRYNELIEAGKTPQEAQETLDTEMKAMSTREIKDMADDIDLQAKKLIQTEVKKMVGDKELKVAATRQQQEAATLQERTNLRNFINKQDTFLGIKLSEEAKKSILRDIDTGNFDKVLKESPEMQKFSAYMLSKHGGKILKKIEASVDEANRAGYNKAQKKATDALHKVDDGGGSSSKGGSGHESDSKKSGDKGSRPGWKNDEIE
jgi:hypothetical protein